MDLTTIMNRLAELGDEQTKKTFYETWCYRATFWCENW